MIIGSKLIFIKNLPSTNSHAALLIKTNELPEGTIIQTNFQSAGRGQTGNRWESEENKNLLISVVLFPSMIHPEDQFQISMALSLGVADFFRRYISSVSIKWPNDIYVNNDKIAGILIENSVMGDSFEYSIAGIGLNINQERFLSDAPNPVSLKQLTGLESDLALCLNELASDLDKRYKQLITGDIGRIHDEYVANLYGMDWTAFSDSQGLFTGRVTGITDSGKLQIERQDGTKSEYNFKEVDFIHRNYPIF